MRAITVREILKAIHLTDPNATFTIWDNYHGIYKRGTYTTFCRDVEIGKNEIVCSPNDGYIDLVLQFIARKGDGTLRISKIGKYWWIDTEKR